MCGDGANDCGALKAADVGIALSDSEASIAAPFTCRSRDISSVYDLLLEGRCCLDTSITFFKFFAMYALIQIQALIILYTVGSNLSDQMFIMLDLLIAIPITLYMGYTRPIDYL